MNNSELNGRLKSILLRHEGEARAITGRELAAIFDLRDDRRVRLAIRELRKEYPILSSGRGYYMPTTWKELNEWAGTMRSRLIEDALTRRDVISASRQYLPPEQGVLI